MLLRARPARDRRALALRRRRAYVLVLDDTPSVRRRFPGFAEETLAALARFQRRAQPRRRRRGAPLPAPRGPGRGRARGRQARPTWPRRGAARPPRPCAPRRRRRRRDAHPARDRRALAAARVSSDTLAAAARARGEGLRARAPGSRAAGARRRPRRAGARLPRRDLPRARAGAGVGARRRCAWSCCATGSRWRETAVNVDAAAGRGRVPAAGRARRAGAVRRASRGAAGPRGATAAATRGDGRGRRRGCASPAPSRARGRRRGERRALPARALAHRRPGRGGRARRPAARRRRPGRARAPRRPRRAGAGAGARRGARARRPAGRRALGEALAAAVRGAVAGRGAGLVVLGGRKGLGSGEYADTPLEALLPVARGLPRAAAAAGVGLARAGPRHLVLDVLPRPRREGLLQHGAAQDRRRQGVGQGGGADRAAAGTGSAILGNSTNIFWIAPLGEITDREAVLARIDAGLAPRATGSTSTRCSTRRARRCAREPGGVRHVLVLCDAEDIDQYEIDGPRPLLRPRARDGPRGDHRLDPRDRPPRRQGRALPADGGAARARGTSTWCRDIVALPRYLRLRVPPHLLGRATSSRRRSRVLPAERPRPGLRRGDGVPAPRRDSRSSPRARAPRRCCSRMRRRRCSSPATSGGGGPRSSPATTATAGRRAGSTEAGARALLAAHAPRGRARRGARRGRRLLAAARARDGPAPRRDAGARRRPPALAAALGARGAGGRGAAPARPRRPARVPEPRAAAGSG